MTTKLARRAAKKEKRRLLRDHNLAGLAHVGRELNKMKFPRR